jgi:hypothetical protein
MEHGPVMPFPWEAQYSLNAWPEYNVSMEPPKMPYPPMHYPKMPYPKHRHCCMVDAHKLHKAYRRSKKTTRTLKKLLRQCHCGYHPHHESSRSRWESSSSRRWESSSSSSVYGTEEQDS